MNGSDKTNLFLEDQIRETLKELNPAKLTEMIGDSKKLGYTSLIDYLLTAHELYKGLIEENKKGKLLVILSHNPTPISRQNGKMHISIGDDDRLINFKIKGLEYNRGNGNGNGYQK